MEGGERDGRAVRGQSDDGLGGECRPSVDLREAYFLSRLKRGRQATALSTVVLARSSASLLSLPRGAALSFDEATRGCPEYIDRKDRERHDQRGRAGRDRVARSEVVLKEQRGARASSRGGTSELSLPSSAAPGAAFPGIGGSETKGEASAQSASSDEKSKKIRRVREAKL